MPQYAKCKRCMQVLLNSDTEDLCSDCRAFMSRPPPPQTYCRPLCVGTQSEGRVIGRKIQQLLDATECINSYVCGGELPGILVDLRYELFHQLRAEGWRIRLNPDNDKWAVLPPERIIVPEGETV